MSLTPDNLQRMLDNLKAQMGAPFSALAGLPPAQQREVLRRAKLEEAEAQCKLVARGSKSLTAKLEQLRALYPENPVLVFRLLIADYVPDEAEQFLVNKITDAIIAYGSAMGPFSSPFELLSALCQGNLNREAMVKHALAQRLPETLWPNYWADSLMGI